MIITFLLTLFTTLNQYKDIYYDIIDDTVICYNVTYEKHSVMNNDYETVVCSVSTTEKAKFLLFLIPPEHVSNTVYCQAYGFENLECPKPRKILGYRTYD